MISELFSAVIYNPLYNGLIFLVGALPAHDVGLAVIVLTIVVRILIYPLSRQAVQTQMAMKSLTPDIEALKKKHKDNKEEQSRAIFALYKERGVHPFSGLLLVLVQLPVLIGLYFVFARGGLPVVDAKLLYSFVTIPDSINMNFAGFFDMKGHSYLLAVVAGITQFLYIRLSMGPAKTIDPSPVESTLSGEMAKSFDLSTRYMMPVTIAVIAASLVAAAPLYWCTSNIAMIIQELIAGKRFFSSEKETGMYGSGSTSQPLV